MMDSGEIRRIRKDVLMLTQAELAKALEVWPSTVKAWEAGKQLPRLKTRRKLIKLMEEGHGNL